jgi:predicted nucleotidyltransferase
MNEIDVQLCKILNSYPFIKLAILFGSMAQNGAKFESDLDLAVQSDHVLTTEEKMELTSDLAQQFMRPIDLIDLRTVGEPLLGQIIVKGRRIIGTDTTYGDLIARHVYAEADFMPYQRRILKQRRDAWIGS